MKKIGNIKIFLKYSLFQTKPDIPKWGKVLKRTL